VKIQSIPPPKSSSSIRTGELENWRTGELENWRTGELENWRTKYF
jgi:hypothetical protein